MGSQESEISAEKSSITTIVITVLAISSAISYTFIAIICVKHLRREQGAGSKPAVRVKYVPKVPSNTTATAHQRRFVPPRYFRNRESKFWKNTTDPGPSNQPQPKVSLVRSLEILEMHENSAEGNGGEDNPLFQTISMSNLKEGKEEHRPIANFSARSCESLDYIDAEEINVPQSNLSFKFSKGKHSLETRMSLNNFGKEKQEQRPVADYSAHISDDIDYVDMEGTMRKIPSEDGYINLNEVESNVHVYMNRSNLEDEESLAVYENCMTMKQLAK